ncbi:MAG: hypothetical protein ACFFC7_04460 [Candidatus Hermodarchaeota archaeon]
MDPLILIIIGLIIAGFFTFLLYLLSVALVKASSTLASQDDIKLKRQLFQCGETVRPQERPYLAQNYYWISFFSILFVIVFMIASMFVLVAEDFLVDNGVLVLLYMGIGLFTVLMLARSVPQPKHIDLGE